MASSNWSIVTTTTDEIKHPLSIFVTTLMMTRSIHKFLEWNSATVTKAFKWADEVNKKAQGLDDVQIQALAKSSIPHTNIYFIDKDESVSKGIFGCCLNTPEVVHGKERVIRDPIVTLLKTILTSPLLSCCKRGHHILQEALKQASCRVGEESTLKIAEECIHGIVHFKGMMRNLARVSFQCSQNMAMSILEHDAREESCKAAALLSSLNIPVAENNTSLLQSPQNIVTKSAIETDKASLSFHFLVATYKIAASSESKSLPPATIRKLKQCITSDIQTLRFFAHSLTLTSVEIAVCFHLFHMQTKSSSSLSSPSSSSSSSSTSAAAAAAAAAAEISSSSSSSLPNVNWTGESLQNDLRAISPLCSHTNSPQLLDILVYVIKDNVGRLLLLDDDLAIVYSLVEKWPSLLIPLLCQEIIKYLKTLTTTTTTPTAESDIKANCQVTMEDSKVNSERKARLIHLFTSSLDEILCWPITYRYMSRSSLMETYEFLGLMQQQQSGENENGVTSVDSQACPPSKRAKLDTL